MFHPSAKVFLVLAAIMVLNANFTQAEVIFEVDVASQVNNSQVYRHVENLTHPKVWKEAPENFTPSADWFYKREEGAITMLSGNWYLQGQKNYTLDEKGNFHFKPDPRTIELLDAHVGHPAMRLWVSGTTDNMPDKLIEGGYKAGAYLYNARQPNDYDKWRFYLESMFQWMVDRYGKKEVKRWALLFGFESDWQTKCVYPGTQKLMSKEDNRKEFLKMLDYWQAAAEKVIGKSVYVGCYYALVTQAPPYFRHWTNGTNYATGEKGTPIRFIGFSDWYHIGVEVQKNKKGQVWYDPDTFQLSPFTEDQGGTGEAHSNAYVGGMKFKYEYLTSRLNKNFPSLKNLDIYMPEAGFIQHDPAGFPAPLTFANHHGAALYALRTIAYSHFPKLMAAGNNFSLSVGTRGGWYPDDVKATVFHSNRIQMRMDGQRLLPVEKKGDQKAETEIRAMAVASDANSQTYRLLATNFLNTFHKEPEKVNPANTEPVTFRLSNLPDIGRVHADVYRIDENHNNWWKDWRQYRKANHIEYASKKYGVWAKYGPHFAPYVNDVMGTLREEDRDTWLRKLKEYKKREDLALTETLKLPVKDGAVDITLDLPESGVLYIEVHSGPTEPVRDSGLDLKELSPGWVLQNKVSLASEGLFFQPAAGPASAKHVVEKLSPNTAYVLSLEGCNNSRSILYGVRLGAPADTEPAEAFGQRTCSWNRLCLTAKSDAKGKLAVELFAPAQYCDPEDGAYFRDIQLRKIKHQRH